MVLVPLHHELVAKLQTLRKRRNFDAGSWVATKTKMFSKFLSDSNLKAGVLSLSGGIDSSVVAALVSLVLKKPDTPLKRFITIAQPIHSTAKIQNRAYYVAEHLGIEIITINQTDVHDALTSLVTDALGIEGGLFARGQLKSYQRTPINYYVTQLLNQEGLNAVVVGTGNYDEDGYLRYFCKAGDGVVDVQLINDLHKSEVYEVGRFLNLPALVLDAPPSADLWEGQTDEGEMGFSYDFVELLTEWMKLEENEQDIFFDDVSEEAMEQFETLKAKAELIHKRNAHKVNFPVNLNILD
ncbi:hypothetical protein GEMRC1_012317 [Eukaryota sp. GEM-RC1]